MAARKTYPKRLYVVRRKLSAHQKGTDEYLFASEAPPDDTEHGEYVGVYELVEVARQRVERTLVPVRDD